MPESPGGFVAVLAHVAPVFADREATLDKMEDVVAEARSRGGDLVVFGESFLPGFPLWALVHAPIDTHAFFRGLTEQAVDVPGPQTRRLAALARRHGVHLSVGVTERSPASAGTLYNANLLFGPDGEVLNHRRKIMPTWAERLVWGLGDAADLRPVRTALGALGVLICGENTNPLARYAMAAQGEQIHVATYPPAWPFRRSAPPDYARWVQLRTLAHAFEAKVFILTAAGVLDEAAVLGLAAGHEGVEQVLREAPAAPSLAAGPTGEVVAGPLAGAEGLLVVPVDLTTAVEQRLAHDIAGHYQRHDLFTLTLDQRAQPPIRLLRDDPPAGVGTAMAELLGQAPPRPSRGPG
jgi:nitrilase/aliphatic nitrilase